MNPLETRSETTWQFSLPKDQERFALEAIEEGKVLFFPSLRFKLLPEEEKFLSSDLVGPKAKNISFHPQTRMIKGSVCSAMDLEYLQGMMGRFSEHARTLIESLFPHYTEALEWGKTSFRPVEALGRKMSSHRKDDTRLHVDAFASQPVHGRRLLRVFSNINPYQKPRVWKLGEPFEKVVQRFIPHLPSRPWISPSVLKILGITKSYRTHYDHLMLKLHNAMKADLTYQKTVPVFEFAFPSGSTWVVMTDKTSHAALSGQFLLEQTFYLPPQAMAQPDKAPLHILEKTLGRRLT